MSRPSVLLGAVAYDPKVTTIWHGFRSWLSRHGLDFDFVLYSQYERQVEDLIGGHIDVAWNSPLAWLRSVRLAAAAGRTVSAVAMRDTDRDLTSVVVVRADSDVRQIGDLNGRTVAVGAVDSPQATLIPLARLSQAGVAVVPRRFDIGVGMHGDHIGGEREAARALMSGDVHAACMIDANHVAFVKEGTLRPDDIRIVTQTAPYDHCNLTTASPNADGVRLLRDLLLSMSYGDAEVRPLLDLEGLTKWEPGRTTGYRTLDTAVDLLGFYSSDGRITAADYEP